MGWEWHEQTDGMIDKRNGPQHRMQKADFKKLLTTDVNNWID